MIELEHSPLGGSAASRFMNCTGSFLLQRAQIEAGEFQNSSSEYADRGTAAHELGARCLTEGTEPFEYLGEKIGNYVVGTDIGLEAVQVYVNECRSILEIAEHRSILIEQTIHLPALHPLLRGTVDFAAYSNQAVWLRDYKNGEGVGVSAVNNSQLKYYAFLLIENDARLRTESHDMPVNLGIVQPNFYGIFNEADVWETTLDEIRDWGHNVLLPQMHNLTSQKDAPLSEDFVPGDHCQFCPVLLDCPKMQKAFTEYANADQEFIVMLTDQELDKFYAQREQARRFMTSLEQAVYARLVGGSTIASAKLVEKKTARVWKPGAQEALEATFGDRAWSKDLKSPAQIAKLSTRGKELSLEWGYKPEASGLSVAPVSDPRPAAKPKGNAEVFGGYAQSFEDQGF